MPFTFFKSNKPKNVSEAGKIVSGTVLSIKGDYKSPKTGFEKIKSDFLMDIGAQEKDVDYYARLDDRQKRSQEAMKKLMEKSNKKSKKGKQTKTDKKAEEKKEAMAKLREEGRQRRIKFYKDKDMKFLNLRRSFGLDKEESTA